MRGCGWIVLFLGACGLIWGLSLDTTVGAKSYYSDLESRWVFPRERYHNIGLMGEKQNSIIVASVVAVVGVLLVIAGRSRAPTHPDILPTSVQVTEEALGPMKKCPDCAEIIRLKARICRFCKRQFTDQEIQIQQVAAQVPRYCRQCGAKFDAAFDACQRCGEHRDPARARSP
jgi:hypothetical protein